MNARPAPRRSAMYVALLMTALIVAVIGLSAITLARIELRSAAAAQDVAAARLCAQSAIELGLHALAADPDWRITYTHDAWVPQQPLGPGSCSWKLVDQRDGDLANDPTQPVRLYGQGTVGQAVRIYSVLAEPVRPPNLLVNADMENGTTAWEGLGGCAVESAGDLPHGGAACLLVTNCEGSSAGVSQDLDQAPASGRSYRSEVWVRMQDAPEDVRVQFWLLTSWGVWTAQFDAPAQTTWTRVAGTLTPSWSGSLSRACWQVKTRWTNQDFEIDDAYLAEQEQGPPLFIVQDSWRQEVLP